MVECDALAPSESYTLKAEYLDVDRLLDDEQLQGFAVPRSWLRPLDSLNIPLTPGQVGAVFSSWRSWVREPERSRRVIRLAIANWLGRYDLPPEDRPPPGSKPDGAGHCFYQLGPSSPAVARSLPPQALAAWLGSTLDANFLFGKWGWRPVRRQERSNHLALLILLGQELYRRDFASDPPTPEALVGRYLKSLPSEFLDDDTDQTIPESGTPKAPAYLGPPSRQPTTPKP